MTVPKKLTKSEEEPNGSFRRKENLGLMYQGLLTGIVRIQSGLQHISDAESFRSRTKAALHEIERDAVAAGYEGSDVKETHFAVVAFLDAAILNSKEPVRVEWERKTLQEELFGQTDAGVVFFEKLERLRSRRATEELADMLEVYLLCLLLGFEGRYSGGLRGELYSIQDRLKGQIEDIRGKRRRISPEGLPEETTQQEIVPSLRRPSYGLVAATALLITILLFLAAKLQLIWVSDQVRSNLL